MDISYISILFLTLCTFSNLVFAEDPEGLNPRILRNIRSVKSNMKEDFMKEIDLTYPGKPYPNCGFRPPENQGGCDYEDDDGVSYRFLVGGCATVAHSWPWMVKLSVELLDGRFASCGASLISQNYILTAAHCFESTNPTGSVVFLGSHNDFGFDGTEYPVKRILIHPNYTRKDLYNDIALIEVEEPVELSKKVYPVCLPSAALRNKLQTGNSNITVTGWGLTSEGGKQGEVLREVTVQIIPECRKYYGYIIKQQMCAGLKEGGKDSCSGDSGGPLVLKLKDDSYVQLGIVSRGAGCARAGKPGVYTRVSDYMKWIYDNTDLGN